MTTDKKGYRVRAVHCDHRGGDEEVYAALKRATAPLDRSWARLRKARTIAIKFNQDWALDKVVYFEGQRQQLISDSVARAMLRLLRENTSAKLICADASYFTAYDGKTLDQVTTLAPILREFDVEYLDAHAAPIGCTRYPAAGACSAAIPLQRLVEADARVSVQKMKNHMFMASPSA